MAKTNDNDKVKVTFKVLPNGAEIESNVPLAATGKQLVLKLTSDPSLKIPSKDAQGNDITYKLLHKETGTEIKEKTLKDVGVKDGDNLIMQPFVQAGINS